MLMIPITRDDSHAGTLANGGTETEFCVNVTLKVKVQTVPLHNSPQFGIYPTTIAHKETGHVSTIAHVHEEIRVEVLNQTGQPIKSVVRNKGMRMAIPDDQVSLEVE